VQNQQKNTNTFFENDYEMKNKKNPATHNFHLSIIIGKGSLAKFGYKEKYES
jgi:hypothetical protein